jgi:hypothetical protein
MAISHQAVALTISGFLMAAATPRSADLAVLFSQGETWQQFLNHTRNQHDAWTTNAVRADPPRDIVERFARAGDGLQLLVVAEDWCADSVNTIPYVAKLAAAAGVPLRIVNRAIGAPLLAAHPTRDGRPATPTVVLVRDGEDAGAWVERPAPLQALFFAMATDPESARRFADRASWYTADRGRTTMAEVVALAEASRRQKRLRVSGRDSCPPSRSASPHAPPSSCPTCGLTATIWPRAGTHGTTRGSRCA